MRRLFGIFIILAFSGCSGMDAAECRTADWRAIGYEDGALGHTAAYFGERRRACADHGVAADFDAYLAGRAEGLTQFCRPANGYRLGVQGRAYAGVCPAGLEDAFVAAHADGYGLYTRHAALKTIERRLQHSRNRVQEIEHRLAENTARLVSSDTEGSERVAIALELKQLAEEKVKLAEEIDRLEHDRFRAEREYERYQDFIAARSEP